MKILVLVEDLLFGSAIANFIAKHEWRNGTEFRIVHVVEPFLTNDSQHASFAKLLEVSGEQIMNEALRLVEKIAGLVKTAIPNAIVSESVIEGHVIDGIVCMTNDWPADLVLAGSHGRSGFNHFLLGSISLALISEVPCPVLLIKPDANILKKWDKVLPQDAVEMLEILGNGEQKAPQRILIAVDETSSAEEIIKLVNEHNWTQPAHFKLISIFKDPRSSLLNCSSALGEFYDDSIKLRNAILRRLALKLRDHYHSSHVEEELIKGDAKSAIVEAARLWGADLLVVGCRAQQQARKLVFGSVSLAVLSTAPCPVLLLKQRSREKIHPKTVALQQVVF